MKNEMYSAGTCNHCHPIHVVSLYTKVQVAINAINACESGRVVDYCGPVTYVLDTSMALYGTLQYTIFNTQTGYPLESWQAKYSTAHMVGNILFGAVPKIKLPYLIDHSIPGYEPICELPPTIVPGFYRGHEPTPGTCQPQMPLHGHGHPSYGHPHDCACHSCQKKHGGSIGPTMHHHDHPVHGYHKHRH